MENTTKKRDLYYLVALSVVFFFVYSFFVLPSSGGEELFNSPDETANYFFIRHFISHGSLAYQDEVNFSFDNIVHPRSVNVINGNLVPGSFIGMILAYGLIGKIFSSSVVLFLTPFFSVLGVIYFYKLLSLFFSRRIAMASSLMMLIFPAYWYYSTRGMFTNVFFLNLLIFSAYLAFKINWSQYQRSWKNYLRLVSLGLLLGTAVIVRPAEIVMLFIIVSAAILAYLRKINWRLLLLPFLGGLIVFLPTLLINQDTFGHFFTTGYSNLQSDSFNLLAGASDYSGWGFLSGIIPYLFPFGLDFGSVWENLIKYFFMLHWWYALLLFIGLACYLKNYGNFSNKVNLYLKSSFLMLAWLVLLYGSWQVQDNIDPEAVSLGVSYNRYWLPAFISLLPLAAMGLFAILDTRMKKHKKLAAFLAASIIVALCSYTTFFGTSDSLAMVKKSIVKYRLERESVKGITEADSIILTEREDKIFFPLRRVAVLHPDFDFQPLLRTSSPKIYYYSRLKPDEIQILNKKNFNEKSAEFKLVRDMKNSYFLYLLEK